MNDYGDDGYKMPDREEFQHDPLDHVGVRGDMIVGELVERYGRAGIGATDVHETADICAEILADNDYTVFMSLAGAMVPAGIRKVVSDLIRDGHIGTLMTTGVNLTHDAIEAISNKHHRGRVHPDPSNSLSHGSREHGAEHHGKKTEREHGETLRDEKVDRIYSVYLPQGHFALFEPHLRSKVFPVLEEGGTVSIAGLCCELGRTNSEVNDHERIDEDTGVIAAAYEADVPIYCPAVQNFVLDLRAWTYSQTSSFSLGALADITPLADLTYDADTAGYLLVGGDVPKNFTLQTMLVMPGAYNYGIQIAMDPTATGRLSGAMLGEARSWGKLEKNTHNTTVLGGATIMLPLLVAAAREQTE